MAEQLVVPEALAGERVDRAVALLTGWTRREVQDARRGGLGARRRRARGQEPQARGRRAWSSSSPSRRWRALPAARCRRRRRWCGYEDDDVVVVAKPAGLVVHPGAGHADGTLVNGLLARYPEIADVGDPARPGIVHRLDRDTSGLLVVARSQPRVRRASSQMLAAHDVERRYDALVWGAPDVAARRDRRADRPVGAPTRRAWRCARAGASARTAYEVVDGVPRARRGAARVPARDRPHPPDPGAPAGHRPPGRGRRRLRRPARRRIALDRPFLHAGGLAFAHPVTGEPVAVEEPLAPELTALLDQLAVRLTTGVGPARRRSVVGVGPELRGRDHDRGRRVDGRGRRRRHLVVVVEAADGGSGLGLGHQPEVGARSRAVAANAVTLSAPAVATSLRRCMPASRLPAQISSAALSARIAPR